MGLRETEEEKTEDEGEQRASPWAAPLGRPYGQRPLGTLGWRPLGPLGLASWFFPCFGLPHDGSTQLRLGFPSGSLGLFKLGLAQFISGSSTITNS